MPAAPLWQNVVGWVILCTVLFALAALLLLPLNFLLRKLWPRFRPPWIARLLTTAIVAAAVWYVTPWLLHLLYYSDLV